MPITENIKISHEASPLVHWFHHTCKFNQNDYSDLSPSLHEGQCVGEAMAREWPHTPDNHPRGQLCKN